MRQNMLAGLSLKRRTTFHNGIGAKVNTDEHLEGPFSFDSWDDVVPSVNERDPISRDEKRNSKLPVYAASREEAVTDWIAYRRQRKIASNHRLETRFLLFNPSASAKRTLKSKLDHERRARTSFNF